MCLPAGAGPELQVIPPVCQSQLFLGDGAYQYSECILVFWNHHQTSFAVSG